MVQYLIDLKVEARDISVWRCGEHVIHLSPDDPAIKVRVVRFLHAVVQRTRDYMAGGVSTAEGASGGCDWTVRRRLLRSKHTFGKRHLYRTVWQGSVLHKGNGGLEVCPHCGQDNTLEHIFYECPKYTRHIPGYVL